MSINPLTDDNTLQNQLAHINRNLSILYDISNAMHTTLELNHTLYIILTGVTAHTGLGFNRAALFLVNKQERILEGKMGIGPESEKHADEIWTFIEESNQNLDDLIAAYKNFKDQNESPFHKKITQLKIPLSKEHGGLLVKACFEGLPLTIKENTVSKHSFDLILKVFKTNELVIMPLKAKDKVNGLIVADNLFTKKPITEDDLKIFAMLANQAGLAIENSQLFEMVVHKSHTDSLTSLWNHGYFQDTLLREILKAKEQKTSVSLTMIDIDDFKRLNDRWGHRCGDIILTEIAKILKNSSRETDYVCRYGGEEFAVILSNTSKEQAYIISERLRERIANHIFPNISRGNPLELTVSIGIAEFPKDAQTKEELVSQADKAMYTAKFIGKNTTYLTPSNAP